jgi:hypothetical protein
MTLEATTLLQTIEDAARGLLFPSESDFPIEPFLYGDQRPTPAALLERRGLAPDTNVDETTLEDFFAGLTEAPKDASEEERASAGRFRSLMKLLEKNLDDIRVYRLGKVDIEVVVLGRDASGTWLGVRTNVVET